MEWEIVPYFLLFLSQLISKSYFFFLVVERYSQEEQKMITSTIRVSELCGKNAFLYSACCIKANRKKQNNDLVCAYF